MIGSKGSWCLDVTTIWARPVSNTAVCPKWVFTPLYIGPGKVISPSVIARIRPLTVKGFPDNPILGMGVLPPKERVTD